MPGTQQQFPFHNTYWSQLADALNRLSTLPEPAEQARDYLEGKATLGFSGLRLNSMAVLPMRCTNSAPD